jgi:membrane protease YdiL (CAAX protease family)
MDNNNPVPDSPDKRILLASAWSSVLMISELPDIIIKIGFGQVPSWLLLSKLVYLAVLLGLCFLWRPLRPLRPFAFVMLVFFAALTGSEWLKNLAWWKGLLADAQPSFALTYLRPFLRDIGVTLIVMAALWMVKKHREDFFLAKGRLGAPVEPVRWLGIRAGESWNKFGWIFAVCAALGVAVPTLLILKPSSETFIKTLPLLPAVLAYSAINAFNEELYFRSTFLSTLTGVIGKNHTLLLNAVFFGLAHWLFGSPPGLAGFAMTGFLAWLLGRSMLETKGFLWPWFIHFLPDVVIFISYAVIWVQQAGK